MLKITIDNIDLWPFAIHTVELIHKRKYCNTLEKILSTSLDNQFNSDQIVSQNAFPNIKFQACNGLIDGGRDNVYLYDCMRARIMHVFVIR